MPAQSEPLNDQSQNNQTCIRLSSGASTIGTWEVNLKNKAVKVSKQTAQIFGYDVPSDDWSFDSFLDHVVAEDRPLMDRFVSTLFEKPENVEIEHRIRRADGQTRWIRNVGGIEYDEKKTLFGYVA